MNDWLEQFPPRDNGSSQVKLAEGKSMDILGNTPLVARPTKAGQEGQKGGHISNWHQSANPEKEERPRG
eukprot:5561280-Ditylum_brightwellii.AAC.1